MIIQLDMYRRLIVTLAGGFSQEQHVDGIGWVVADDQEWKISPETINEIRKLWKRVIREAKL